MCKELDSFGGQADKMCRRKEQTHFMSRDRLLALKIKKDVEKCANAS